MAFEDEERKKELAGEQAQGSAPGTGVSSAQSAFIGGTGGAAGAGGGAGSNPWTNIQAYLNANKGNTSSSKYLQDKIGTTFDDESSRLKTEASAAENQAKSFYDKTNFDDSQVRGFVDQAADNDTSAAQKLKDAVNTQYGGPQGFAFGFNNKVQEYGSGLQNQGFQAFMDKLYKDAAGGKITQGQLDLQRQFDVQGESANKLEETRKNALAKYAGLQTDFNSLVPQTDQKVKDYQTQFGQKQNAVKESLGGYQGKNFENLQGYATGHNDYNSRIASAVNQALTLNPTSNVNYRPGTSADVYNIGGQDADIARNRWNTIADILGNSQRIQKNPVTAMLSQMNTGIRESSFGPDGGATSTRFSAR